MNYVLAAVLIFLLVPLQCNSSTYEMLRSLEAGDTYIMKVYDDEVSFYYDPAEEVKTIDIKEARPLRYARVTAERIFVAGGNGLVVLDATQKVKLGRYTIGPVDSIAVGDNGTVYASGGGRLFAIPPWTEFGEVLPTAHLNETVWGMAVWGERVYTAGEDTVCVFAVRGSALGVVAQYKSMALGHLFAAEVSDDGKVLYVGGLTGVFALDVATDGPPQLLGEHRFDPDTDSDANGRVVRMRTKGDL
eukprot:Sspe_Gene.49667::Locus_26961_Transcript_1_1_Confidence_1.000_Length_776::g.49667::m.49667